MSSFHGGTPPQRPDDLDDARGRYGRYGQQPGQGQYGQHPQPRPGVYGAPGGAPWAPVPRPGIVPLAPLRLGDYFSGAWKLVRTHAALLYAIAAFLGVVGAVYTGVATWFSESIGAVIAGGDSISSADGFTVVLGYVVLSVLMSYATIVLYGVAGLAASRGALGERLGGLEARAALRAGSGRLVRLTGLYILASILVVAVFVLLLAVAIVPLMRISASGSSSDAALGPALGILLLVLVAMFVLMIPLMYLMSRVFLAPAILLVERWGHDGAEQHSAAAAVGRSWALTRGEGWRLTGINFLVLLIVGTVTSIVSFPLSLAAMPGTTAAAIVVTAVLSGAVAALVAPFQAAVPALAYLDMRMRKENLGPALAQRVRLA